MTGIVIKKPSVVVVDAHYDYRDAIIQYLQTNGMEATGCATGYELLEYLKNVPQPDVVIISYTIDNKVSTSTVLLLRQLYPNIKILIAKVFIDTSPLMLIEIAQMGANGLLIKSGDPEEWIRAIDVVIEGEFYFYKKK